MQTIGSVPEGFTVPFMVLWGKGWGGVMRAKSKSRSAIIRMDVSQKTHSYAKNEEERGT